MLRTPCSLQETLTQPPFPPRPFLPAIFLLVLFHSATTHTDLLLRARHLQIPTRTIHNASILTAIASTGLQLYSFGQTLSMVFFTPTWRPTSWHDRLQENWALGLHTLILLDIKVKEIDLHQLALRGSCRRILLDDEAAESQGVGEYAKPRFMTVSECALQMLDVSRDIKADQEGQESTSSFPSPTLCCSPNTLVVGVARLGTDSQRIVSGTLEQLAKIDLGEPLHSLVVIGRKCHELERDFVREFAVDTVSWDEVWQNGGYGTM